MNTSDADTLPRGCPAGGDAMSFRVGLSLGDGRYTLIEPIGEGGMAEVFRAKHNLLGKEFAIKLLKPSFASDEHIRSRFLREGQALSRVVHENVVSVTDVGVTSDGVVFLAMELLSGEPLYKTLDRDGPLPWARAKVIALQVCRALHAAHQCGVVHRDVKPENCWRMKRGRNRDYIKILDFGIAKMFPIPGDHVAKITTTGEVFGTPEYMSPEQAAGKPADERSDIYAVGILLYKMATGGLPFSGNTSIAILSKQLYDHPTPPRSFVSERMCPNGLEKAILRALAKDPRDRYASMRDFAEDLANVAPVTHPMSASPSNVRSKLRANTILTSALGLALAIATIIFAYYVLACRGEAP